MPTARGVRLVLALILAVVLLPPSEALATDATSDPLTDLQWALHNSITAGADMDVPDAWTSSRGGAVTVAVVDTGVATGHPDLAGKVDPRSRNFAADAPSTAIDDLDGHGTKVAGVIAAGANGVGTVGVAPDAQVLALRAFGAEGVGDEQAIAAAFDYAGELGIPIVNASFNGPGRSAAIEQAITSHPGTLFVVAAGNGNGADDDAVPTYPCDLPAANVLCVGASTSADSPAVFSNVGAHNVDLFAPGASIAAPVLSGWALTSGTSIAAANVAGVAALVLGAVPTLTTPELKAALLESGDAIPALHGLSATGRRANAARAVALALAGPIPADANGDGVADPAPVAAAAAVVPPTAPAAPPVVATTPDPPDVAATAPVTATAAAPTVVSFRVEVPRHGRTATATARASRSATLALRIERRRCAGTRCAWHMVAARTVAGTRASLRKRLARGSYRAHRRPALQRRRREAAAAGLRGPLRLRGRMAAADAPSPRLGLLAFGDSITNGGGELQWGVALQ